MKEDTSTKNWKFPSLDLLDGPVVSKLEEQDTKRISKIINDVLMSNNIYADVNPDDVKVGPTFTRYPVMVKSPVYISKLLSIQNKLALAINSPSGTVRIEMPTPGQYLVGMERPNETRQTIYYKSVVKSLVDKETHEGIQFPIGVDVESNVHNTNIKDWPNALIAGSTGSGKSLLLHNIILSMFFTKTPDEIKLILMDPKSVEFYIYEGIPHLLRPVITDMNEAVDTLSWLLEEAKRREEIISKANVKTNTEYNRKVGVTELPDIIVINDEVGDIMVRGKGVAELQIIKLAQVSQTVGIHQILSTSRPSTDAFTGLVRANISTRVAFMVHTNLDSKIAIAQPGAEKLTKNGDMLFLPPKSENPIRLQAPYISTEDINRVVDFVKAQNHNEKNQAL